MGLTQVPARQWVTAMLLTLAVVLNVSYAQADTIRGVVKKIKGDNATYLVVEGNPTSFKIVANSPSVISGALKLNDGDSLTARGRLIPEKGEAFLFGIESVGLKSLIGVWHSPRWEVYEFRDFSRLNLYVVRSAPTGKYKIKKSRELAYVIAPESGDRYSIFMSDNRNVLAGSLQMNKGQVDIMLFDTMTGQATENISLKPLPVQ